MKKMSFKESFPIYNKVIDLVKEEFNLSETEAITHGSSLFYDMVEEGIFELDVEGQAEFLSEMFSDILEDVFASLGIAED